jgi:hypothetical protein
VWFDGGYPNGTAEPIAALLQQLQPNAVAFGGPGANAIRWVGTESGFPLYPLCVTLLHLVCLHMFQVVDRDVSWGLWTRRAERNAVCAFRI